MIDNNNKKILAIGIVVFVVILAIAIIVGVSLTNISSDTYSSNTESQTSTEDIDKKVTENKETEKSEAEDKTAEEDEADKTAAEKAAAEKAAAEKAAAEKAEKERLENLSAGFVSGYYNYNSSNRMNTFEFTFQQTQNVKYITIHLLNFAGDKIYAENWSGTSSNEFKIVPTGLTAYLALYNTTDSIENIEIIVTYNNGKTETFYDAYGLG